MAEATRDLITMATQFYSMGWYSKSIDLYIAAFEQNPELKALHEVEFRAALNRQNEVLASSEKMQDIFQNLERATILFPDNIHLVNDTGRYLYKFGFYAEAWCHFQKALQMDAGFVAAEKSLNSIKNLLVERWHYRMLNDKIRNESYRKAISETLIPFKDTVLDIGSGTGILTLYAMECKPLAAAACDKVEQMAKITEYVLEDYKINDVIVVNKAACGMTHKDIGGKKSLLLTEIFDAGLIGEHVLPVIALAHEDFLLPWGRIIPAKAEYFVIGAKSQELNSLFKLSKEVKELLNIPKANIHKSVPGVYDCQDVNMFKDLKYMTHPVSIFEVDFNDFMDVLNILQNREQRLIELEVTDDGEVDILIGYFNLYLSESVTITTDPRAENCATAWQQSVYFDFLSQTVKKGQKINECFMVSSEQLLIMTSETDDGRMVERVSTSVIRFLNDSEYVNMITKCLGMASIYLGQMADMSEIKIVDLCPFPLFGLLMLKRGAKSLTCFAQRSIDEAFFRAVFEANGIPASKVEVLVSINWSEESFGDEKYHVVFCNIFEVCGDVNRWMYEISQHLRNGHLLPGGLFMPANVTLMGQVVSSRWLDINNRVEDNNVSGYQIAKYINKYQTSQCYLVPIAQIDYIAITDPVRLGKYGHMDSGVLNVPIIESGEANGILCWYNIEVMDQLGEISTKRSTAFISGMAFLADPKIEMQCGGIANILRCVDVDGEFKLILDVEAT